MDSDTFNEDVREENDVLDLTSPVPTITEQLPDYNDLMVESKINNLKVTLNGQEKLNFLLKKEASEIDNDIKNISFFVDNYKVQVDNQVEQITTLVEKIKNVVSENKKLEVSHENLNNMIQKPEMIEIAKKMKIIKDMSKDIDIFLEKNGI